MNGTNTWTNWKDDPRGWPERMELARQLGGFQPGDEIAITRLISHVADDSPTLPALLDFHASIMRGDVPAALDIYERLPKLVGNGL